MPVSIYKNFTRVNNETVWQEGEEFFAIEVSLLNNDLELVDKLNFNWECIEFKETEMIL